MRSILFVLIVATLASSCRKKSEEAGKSIEIYHLATYETVAGKCEIDPARAVLPDTPLINNNDILEYSQVNHSFLLTNSAFLRIKGLSDWAGFAVTVDKNVIYYGIFKPSFSSSSCLESVTMDISLNAETKALIRLGYPGISTTHFSTDPRTDKRLFAALNAQGKLKMQ